MSKYKEYQIEIEICSEAIFTSGEKERNTVQTKAQTDPYGFVYFHSKTLKGQLKKQAFWLLDKYISSDKDKAQSFYQSIVTLFGTNADETRRLEEKYNKKNEEVIKLNKNPQNPGIIRLSNLELDKELRDYFISFYKKSDKEDEKEYYRISPHDLIEAQTHIRTGIQIKDGIVKNHMFNTFHTVRKGLVFSSTLTFDETENKITDEVIEDLANIVYSLRRIGAGIHRGRGEATARLLQGEGKKPYYEVKAKEGEQSV